ncbi:MAG: PF20097 family protein [Pseudomonadota bacterium]
MRSSECPKCQGSMAEGFVLDVGQHGSRTVSTWVEGAAEKSFWTGLKIGKKASFPIQTWRCGRCGFLESYARG